jgi:glutamate-1-semialdehyde 2,1-aminomutase
VTPDLFTFGKVMSGGLPAAAFGGRDDVMSSLAPAGPVYQAGTLSGNPVAVAAGIAQLTHCTPDVYARIDAAAEQLGAEVAKTLDGVGIPYRLNRAGNLFSVFFTDVDVVDFTTASTTSSRRYAAFFNAMLDRGVYLPPSAYEAWFLSVAHDDAAIDRILDALPHAAEAASEVAP